MKVLEKCDGIWKEIKKTRSNLKTMKRVGFVIELLIAIYV